MDSENLTDDIQSLHLKLDCIAKSLDKKFLTESQQIGGETVRKSANSNNIIISFLASLRKLSQEELKNTLDEADDILNTGNYIPTDQNLNATLKHNVTKYKLKTVLKSVFELLNSLSCDAEADVNNAVASTSNGSSFGNPKVEEKKLQFWRKYKNKYNYIDKLKVKLPPLNGSDEVVSIQNNANSTVQNDLNKKKYTMEDIMQNENVYELLRCKLENSPYDDSYLKNNTKDSKLTLKCYNKETVVKPMSYVAPLVVLDKFDESNPIPQLNIKTMDKHFQSTLNKTNNSITNNSSEKMTKRETRANKTKDITNGFKTNVKTITKKRRSTIKKSKYETLKKKKN